MTLGLGYFVIMMFGVANVRVPAEGWRPPGFDPASVAAKPLVTTANVSAANAVRTRSFWLLWVVLFCNVTAGIGILEQASPMIQDFFRDNGTSTVTVAAAGGFVGLLSLFNMAGRFVWSSTSDVIGRKPIYLVYLGVGMVLYALLALVGQTATALFVLLACVILSFYGGGFATVPAYLRDLFGTYQVGAIHGRLLTAWSAAGIAGPLIVNGFLDAQGEPGSLTAAAYRPALFTMVGCWPWASWRTCWCDRCQSATTNCQRSRATARTGPHRGVVRDERRQPIRAAGPVVDLLVGGGGAARLRVAQTLITAAKLFTH
ncbi:MFS transporter [Micromonospora sp. M12]